MTYNRKLSYEDFGKRYAPTFVGYFGDSAWFHAQRAITAAQLAGDTNTEKLYRAVMRHIDPRAVRDRELPEIRF